MLVPYDPKSRRLRVDKNICLRVYCRDQARGELQLISQALFSSHIHACTSLVNWEPFCIHYIYPPPLAFSTPCLPPSNSPPTSLVAGITVREHLEVNVVPLQVHVHVHVHTRGQLCTPCTCIYTCMNFIKEE